MAGFTALANQQRCINAPASCTGGAGGVEFINPVVYAVGKNAAAYAKSFHDIIGNSSSTICAFTGQSAPAVAGYDLATGWGSPTCGLVDQLSCTTCTGSTAAPGTPPSSSCVSFQSDSNNCGSCGNMCSGGTMCVSGHCQSGISMGDTHLTTFDGLLYDFQASGDFLLADSNTGFVVQTRQASGAPMWPSAAVNKAVATRMGETRVAICLEPTRLVVDGKPETLDSGKARSLPGGVELSRSGEVYVITRRSGETVRAELHTGWINVSVGLGHAPHVVVRGLLGNADGNTADDIATKTGTVLPQPVSFAELYHRYAESWRIPPGESLLCEERRAESGVPEQPFYAVDLNPKTYEHARAVCVAARVEGAALLDACTLDVAVLGEAEAARAFATEPAPVAVMQAGLRPAR